MKKTYSLQKSWIAVVLSVVVWAGLSFDVFRHAHFRVTYLFGMLTLIFLIYAIVKSYKQKEDGYLILFAGMQSCFWGVFDYVTGVCLGHFSIGTVSLVSENAWAVQLIGVIIALSLLFLFYPIAQRLHDYNKHKRKEASSSPNTSKGIWLIALLVGAGSAARHLLSALQNPIVDLLMNGMMILLAVSVFGIASLLCLLMHLHKDESQEAPKPQVPLL